MTELKILEEKDNALFNRKEVEAVTEAKVTPSRGEVIKALAEKFKVSEENIKVLGIHGKFGSNDFDIKANIYSSSEDKERIELKKKKEEAKAMPEEKQKEESKPDVAPAQEQSEQMEEKAEKESDKENKEK